MQLQSSLSISKKVTAAMILFFFFLREKLLYKMIIIEMDQKLSNMVGLSMPPGEKLEFFYFDMF